MQMKEIFKLTQTTDLITSAKMLHSQRLRAWNTLPGSMDMMLADALLVNSILGTTTVYDKDDTQVLGDALALFVKGSAGAISPMARANISRDNNREAIDQVSGAWSAFISSSERSMLKNIGGENARLLAENARQAAKIKDLENITAALATALDKITQK